MTHRLLDKDRKKPICVIVHSPFTDFSGSLDRHINEVEDFTVKEGCLAPLGGIYAPKRDLKSPYISPAFGRFKGFPPLYITCDENETLFADSLAVYEKCRDSGVWGRLVVMKGAYHAFAALGTGSPETGQILEEMRELICFCLDSTAGK